MIAEGSGIESLRILIAGGGTAGHVLPGIAIGQAFVDQGVPKESIMMVGSERGVETTLVPKAGFPLTLLPGRGIQRKFTTENIASSWGLLKAFGTALSLVGDFDPHVVVSLGGYASVPAAKAALLRRVPVVVAEQNAVPGLANKLVARFAKASAVSFEGTALPRSTWTGNPVRPEILAAAELRPSQRHKNRTDLGVADDCSMLVVFGGSLGARRINEALLGALPDLADRRDLHIRHIIGRRDFAAITEKIPTELINVVGSGPSDDVVPGLIYEPIEYEDDMAAVLAAADLVLCRSGATSCAELAVIGRPSILIPLPGAPGDHQTANARALERVGGAKLIADSDLTSQRLLDEVESLMHDVAALERMGDAARKIARPGAAGAVVDLALGHARQPKDL